MKGISWEANINQYQITSTGKVVLTTDGLLKNQMPYYFQEGSSEDFDGYFWEINLENYGPPIRAGKGLQAVPIWMRVKRSLMFI